MSKDKEKEVLERVLELDSGAAVQLYNFYSEMKMIKKDMVNSLNLLDEVAAGDKEKKKQLRKKILDNYNDMPRQTLSFIDELTKTLKKE